MPRLPRGERVFQEDVRELRLNPFLSANAKKHTFRCADHGNAVHGIATKERMESTRSVVWHQSEGQNTLSRDAIRLRRFHTRCRVMPYQSFGLDKKRTKRLLRSFFGGERGIRTLGTVLAFTRFPIVRLRPAQPSLHSTRIVYHKKK